MDDSITSGRHQRGFLSATELVDTVGKYNLVLDQGSVLIAQDIAIGKDNIFYPNVIIERQDDCVIVIGNGNIFYPGTYIVGSTGTIAIGNENEFGSGGCTIKANAPDAHIVIGDGGRYCDGASVMGKTNLGDGTQILGNITVQGCTLAAGGSYHTPDPDDRAAVLKGFGLARGLTLERGQVVNGSGNFSDRPIEWQHDYHPKAKTS